MVQGKRKTKRFRYRLSTKLDSPKVQNLIKEIDNLKDNTSATNVVKVICLIMNADLQNYIAGQTIGNLSKFTKQLADIQKAVLTEEKLEEIISRLDNNHGITSLDDKGKRKDKKIVALKG